MHAVSVRAYAKVNLDLRVFGVRADGYHAVRTVFQAIDLYDTVHCIQRPGPFAIDCDEEDVPRDGSNLVWRAATALAEATGRGPASNVLVQLDKRIPTRAGLGGGSADAAAALVALSRLWGVELDEERAAQVDLSIGSDVAFFRIGGTALGEGRGERVLPLVDFPEHAVVVAMPPVGVSTADAYRWFDAGGGARGERPPAPRWPASRGEWLPLLGQLGNDLQEAVAARHPEIARLEDALRGAGASLGAMSGSGAAVFGLFGETGLAETALERCRGLGAAAWLTRTLTAAEYRRGRQPVLQLAASHLRNPGGRR